MPDFSPIPVQRGVFQAPWLGANGELVLVAITSDRKLACEPVTVPHDASRVEAADALFVKLDEVDPVGGRRATMQLVEGSNKPRTDKPTSRRTKLCLL